jgi:small subunit ribosomal protein S9
MADAKTYYWGLGRRKTSVARVRLSSGTGSIKVNGKEIDDYFKNFSDRSMIQTPMRAVKAHKNFDMFINVRGGGFTGQAGAVVLGCARALCLISDEYEKTLREESLLTRDSRMKERKKYGQKGARARFQFSKR